MARPRGRPTLLDDEVAERLLAMLRTGSHDKVACQAAGIAQRTFQLWMQRATTGRARDKPYAELAERVAGARAEAEARAVAQIATAAASDWRAAAWLLERRWPDRWARALGDRIVVADTPAGAPPPPAEPDPFAEVDELAARRSAG